MDKITCVIDTCSFIYMQIPTLTESSRDKRKPDSKEKTLFDLFVESNSATIKVTKEIIDEMKDPKKKGITKYNSEYATFFNKVKYKFKKGRIASFHEGIFNKNLYTYNEYGDLKTDDLGEKINLAATIDLFLDDGKRNLVFLSDDLKAQRKTDIISDISSAFRMCLYWDTFDVIFYLYLINKRAKAPMITSSQAESFITDIFSHKSNQAFDIMNNDFDNQVRNPANNSQNTNSKIERNRKEAKTKLSNTFNSQKAEVLKRFEILKKI